MSEQQSERYDLQALRERVESDPGSADFPALAEAERRRGEPAEARRVAEAGLAAAPGRLAGRVALGLALVDLGEHDLARQELGSILDAALEPHVVEPSAEDFSRLVEDSSPLVEDSSPLAEHSTPFAEDSSPVEGLADIVAEPIPAGAEPPAFDEAVADSELEEAFAAAEPQVDEMISPNRMAEQVLLDHAPVDDGGLAEDMEDDLAIEPAPAFRTATMAELLERQGNEAAAEAIRRELDPPASPSAKATPEPAGVTVDAATAPESDFDWPSVSAVEAEPGDLAAEATNGRILRTLETWLQNIQRGRA